MKKILVVDDEAEICEVIQEHLRDIAEVHIASDGFEALRKIENEKFDLVISDYDMPRMDGLNLLKTVLKKRTRCPVILMTGRGSDELQKQGWRNGSFEYLEKPFKLDSLRVTAITCLDVEKNSVPFYNARKRRIRSKIDVLKKTVSEITADHYQQCLLGSFKATRV